MSENRCGDCHFCCKVMGVEELGKPAGTQCGFVQIGKGCGAYETRPESCREFECFWLQSQGTEHALAPDLRPDLCKVVLGGSGDGQKSFVYVDPRNPDAWRKGKIARIIDTLANRFVVIVVNGPERIFHGKKATDLLFATMKEKNMREAVERGDITLEQ